jgi:hypothetical protein
MKPTFYDYDNKCWIVGGKIEACNHPAVMSCRCYGKLHAGEIATKAQTTAWKARLVSMFVEQYGDDYVDSDDKWIVVNNFLAEHNIGVAHDNDDLTDEIDQAVSDCLYADYGVSDVDAMLRSAS